MNGTVSQGHKGLKIADNKGLTPIHMHTHTGSGNETVFTHTSKRVSPENRLCFRSANELFTNTNQSRIINYTQIEAHSPHITPGHIHINRNL